MEFERLAVVENEVKNVKDAVRDVKDLVTRLDEKINQKFENLTGVVAHKTEIQEVNDRIDKEIKPEITDIKNKKQLKENLLWIGLLCSTIVNVIMVYTLFNN